MTEHVITLPEPEIIVSVKDELLALVTAIDAQREPGIDSTTNGFTILADFINGSLEDMRMGYDFGRTNPRVFNIVRDLARPLLQPIVDHESALGENIASKFSTEAQRRIMWPGDITGLGWHSGDPDRYLLSNYGTNILVGDLHVPANYKPSEVFENVYKHDGLGGRHIAGDVARQVLKTGTKLPEGLRIVTPKPGEVARISRDHVHRTPPSPPKDSVDRIFWRVDPR
jgi:hypothetical protein